MVTLLYQPILLCCLRFRYVTVCIAAGLLVLVVGYATSSHMGMILMPEVSADEIEAGVRMPVGTTQAQSAEIARVVTEASLRMFEEHNLYEVAEGIKTNVRGQDFIDVEIVLKPPDQRDMTANEVIELWRDSIGDLPGVDQVTFEAERGPGGGGRRDISIALSHTDIGMLEKAAAEFSMQAETFANVRDVSDNYSQGKAQYDFRLRPEGRALGLTDEELGEQLRGAFFGSLALRLLRGTNEVEVRVKLPEEQREDIHHLEDLVIRTPSGTEVPLLDVAELTKDVGFSRISRRDGRRAIRVSMDVEPKRAINQVVSAFQTQTLPELRRSYPGLTWTFEGSDAEMREATSALWGYFGLALAVIYALLAVAFRGYIQPLIVLVAIPFGIVGAALGHIWLGYDISLVSVMGVIALSGVVINDSLIMIDYANRRRAEDASAFEAISQAGIRRFRPILLTTLTTFGGLMPLIFEKSLQAQYIIPMAISLGFGILFSTAIILVLIPCLYLILEDILAISKPASH
jgi:multidrug efflux pump subunit AcrB